MKKQKAIAISLGIIIFIFVLTFIKIIFSSPGQASPNPDTLTQTDSQGAVTVSVTPADLASSQWRFEISMETHSVELDMDLTKTSQLTVAGREILPTSWEGDPPGGHHRQGTLLFQRPEKVRGEIQLILSDIGDIPQRTFTWEGT